MFLVNHYQLLSASKQLMSLFKEPRSLNCKLANSRHACMTICGGLGTYAPFLFRSMMLWLASCICTVLLPHSTSPYERMNAGSQRSISLLFYWGQLLQQWEDTTAILMQLYAMWNKYSNLLKTNCQISQY